MISKKEVQHIAKLARLGLTNKEIEKMQQDLSLVLDYFNLLKGVNISKVEPTSHSISKFTTFGRKDEAKRKGSEEVDKLITAVPDKEERYVRVKEIL